MSDATMPASSDPDSQEGRHPASSPGSVDLPPSVDSKPRCVTPQDGPAPHDLAQDATPPPPLPSLTTLAPADPALSELLLRWEEARRRGQAPTAKGLGRGQERGPALGKLLL
jgi:hypothetical protein